MEIKINKEIRDYQESVAFGLTMRQVACSVAGIGAGLGLYFLLKDSLNKELISWVCLATVIPFAVVGFFKYNGMPAEKFIIALFSSYINGGMLVFKSENYILKELDKIEKRGKKHGKNAKKQHIKRAV